MTEAFRKMTLALLVISTVFVSFSALAQSSNPQTGHREASRNAKPSVVIQWNDAALQGVRDSKIGPPMVARALAIIHTCI